MFFLLHFWVAQEKKNYIKMHIFQAFFEYISHFVYLSQPPPLGWIVSPSKILNLNAQDLKNVTLIGDKVFIEIIKLKGIIGWASSNMIHVLTKRKFGSAETYKQG